MKTLSKEATCHLKKRHILGFLLIATQLHIIYVLFYHTASQFIGTQTGNVPRALLYKNLLRKKKKSKFVFMEALTFLFSWPTDKMEWSNYILALISV